MRERTAFFSILATIVPLQFSWGCDNMELDELDERLTNVMLNLYEVGLRHASQAVATDMGVLSCVHH